MISSAINRLIHFKIKMIFFQKTIFSVIKLLILMKYVIFVSSVDDPEDFVNLLAGSFTDGNSFSTGNTLPLVGLPFAFNHWSPQTIDENPYSGSW